MHLLSKLSCRSTHLLAAITLLSFSAKADSFGFTGGLQQYTVAASGVYQITADGASGATFNPETSFGGLGASMTGTFNLMAGTVIDVYVGQEGSVNGGGGGTFVLINGSSSPLLVAGGGGGAGFNPYFAHYDDGLDASLTTSGNSSGLDAPSGTGGGGGGSFSTIPIVSGVGSGGGGWNGNGRNGNLNGLPGGGYEGGQGYLTGSPILAGGSPGGGYGGGGGGGGGGIGGGGGYSGGGGGGPDYENGGSGGGGGGSYVDESALSSSAVLLTTYGDGSAEITPESASVPEPASVWLVSLSLFGIAFLSAVDKVQISEPSN